MSSKDARDSKALRSTTPRAVDDLASLALSRVAGRKIHVGPVQPTPEVTNRLLEATMHRSPETHRAVVAQMLEAGITPEAIADIYIPEVARRMGTEWEDDVSGFAQVTLGSAHLQSLLRDLDSIWDTGHSGIGKDARPLVLVMTIPEAQHTLGATILSTQLRRLGCSVRLQAGRSVVLPEDDRSPDTCDAIFASASRSDPASDVARMIAGLRREMTPPPPIVLGGTILDVVDDPLAATNADFATLDPVAALAFCKLPVGTSGADR